MIDLKALYSKINKPLFITFEGGEGVGKSTQSKMLYEYLVEQGIKVVATREVGGTPEAEKVRNILLHSKDLAPISELMLVMAARYEHMEKVIIPALRGGNWVICDRFVDSSACYQGQFPEVTKEKVYRLHNELMPPLFSNNANKLPDITFLIDLPLEVALQRALSRGDNNKYEDKEIKFHQKIYQSFHSIAKEFSDRVIKIETNDLSTAQVHNNIVSQILTFIQKTR